jgi:uncharacterized coiled-coil protein SlyX
MFHDFDPYQKLEELFLRSYTHEHNLDTVHDQLKDACRLMEQMADQLRHLTRAIQGLQEQNKILHARLERLESRDD